MDKRFTGAAGVLIRAVSDFIFLEDQPQPSDIIFIPGTAHPAHALHAARLYHEGYAPLLLPSGRFTKAVGSFQGVSPAHRAAYPGPYESEWDFLRHVLQQEGVPASAILREDQATFTLDNAVKSRAVTDRMGLTVRRAILCCMPFHALRAKFYYASAYPETEILVCPPALPGMMRDDWYLTSRGQNRVLGEVQRMGDQVKDTFLRDLARIFAGSLEESAQQEDGHGGA